MTTSTLDTAKGVLAYLSWRLAMVVLITIPFFLGGVWFVVDLSLRGIENAVSTTNTRITDLRSDLKELDSHLLDRLNPKFDKIISQMNKLENEFKSESTSIKDFMKRVSVENESLALSFWTTEKIEIAFPTSSNMPMLEDFVNDPSYSTLKKNLIFDNSATLTDVKVVPLIDDSSFTLAKSGDFSLIDYTITSQNDIGKVKTVIQKLSDCVRYKQLSSQKMIIQATNLAIILNGTVGCPITSISALKQNRTK